MDITFEQMLDDVYSEIQINPSEYNLLLPQIEIVSSPSKVHWINIMEYLKILNRTSEHFINFLQSEFYNKKINWYSNDENNGIVIHGKYIKKEHISILIKKYINIYVICGSCLSPKTTLTKNKKKFLSICGVCHSNKII